MATWKVPKGGVVIPRGEVTALVGKGRRVFQQGQFVVEDTLVECATEMAKELNLQEQGKTTAKEKDDGKAASRG